MAGCGSSAESTSAARRAEPSLRIAVVVLENHGYDEVIDNPEMPYLNGLAKRGALTTDYHGVAHPSLPNYLALFGGSTFGIEDDCTDCTARGDNLAAQLSRAHRSWRAYLEDMPETCYPGEARDGYVKRHNPFMYFPSIYGNRERCENVNPATQLDHDIGHDSLTAFSWISPSLCNDGHDCSLEVADRWLAETIPGIVSHLGPRGFVAITFDEDDVGASGARQGRVATVLAGPSVIGSKRVRRHLDHYSLLATIEDEFGLPRLRNARGAPTLRAALR